MSARTLYDKLWDTHWVGTTEEGSTLIYIDRHLVHEVTSPQAFEGLRLAKRPLWRRETLLATPDHNVPTTPGRSGNLADPFSRLQVETLDQNSRAFSLNYFPMLDPRQGIVHIIGPEQGATLPGMTVVCGDSHTATHGAFAALAFGIGTSEVEHVMATQCLVQKKAKNFAVTFVGQMGDGITAKDLALALIGTIGTAGGTGYTLEFRGEAIQSLSMEGRMTLCNMAIEAGARSGLIAVDETTVRYLKGRPMSPQGQLWEQAVVSWQDLVSDPYAVFDKEVILDINHLAPQVTWGTSPEMVIGIDQNVPDPAQAENPVKRQAMEKALHYMGLEAGQPITEIPLDRIFIGSCTNGRIEDLRAAANTVKGKRAASSIKQALVVPGSGLVKRQAEEEGIAKILVDAGFEWREPGCSMCLGMNEDRLLAGEHCASTSNRNFEGRQGSGGRTHLVSPAMAAAAAIAGHFVDIRNEL